MITLHLDLLQATWVTGALLYTIYRLTVRPIILFLLRKWGKR